MSKASDILGINEMGMPQKEKQYDETEQRFISAIVSNPEAIAKKLLQDFIIVMLGKCLKKEIYRNMHMMMLGW